MNKTKSGARRDLTAGERASFYCNINVPFSAGTDISDIFIALTRELQQFYPIKKGLLIAREKDSTHFMATASFSREKTRKNLSLRLPSVSSLFEKVAEGGLVYTENCGEFFSGNSFERNLLLDADTRSFVVLPLKHHGEVMGIIGYSSDDATAFAIFEEGLLDDMAGWLAARIAADVSSTQIK